MSIFTFSELATGPENIRLIKEANTIVGRDLGSKREIVLFDDQTEDLYAPTLDSERDLTIEFNLLSPERDRVRDLIRSVKGENRHTDNLKYDHATEGNASDTGDANGPVCPDCGGDAVTGYARDPKKFTCDSCGSQFQYHGNGEYSE